MNHKQRTTYWPLILDTVNEFAFMQFALTKEECEKIIEYGNKLESLPGNIASNKSNLELRKSTVSWIYPNSETNWLYIKLADAINELNLKYFNFDISGLAEGIQFTKYNAPGDHYDLHTDCCFGAVIRKLSIVIQLSDPSEYDGGELVIVYSVDGIQIEKEQGRLTIFPSYTLHKVNPITQGTRYSLVAWATGPNFR